MLGSGGRPSSGGPTSTVSPKIVATTRRPKSASRRAASGQNGWGGERHVGSLLAKTESTAPCGSSCGAGPRRPLRPPGPRPTRRSGPWGPTVNCCLPCRALGCSTSSTLDRRTVAELARGLEERLKAVRTYGSCRTCGEAEAHADDHSGDPAGVCRHAPGVPRPHARRGSPAEPRQPVQDHGGEDREGFVGIDDSRSIHQAARDTAVATSRTVRSVTRLSQKGGARRRPVVETASSLRPSCSSRLRTSLVAASLGASRAPQRRGAADRAAVTLRRTRSVQEPPCSPAATECSRSWRAPARSSKARAASTSTPERPRVEAGAGVGLALANPATAPFR